MVKQDPDPVETVPAALALSASAGASWRELPPVLRTAARVVGAAAVLGASWLVARAAWRRARRTKRVRVDAIYVYPIKGCRGHSLSSVELTPWGLKDDRRYMIASAKGEFVSQRMLPLMALIHPDLPKPEGITLRAVAADDGSSSAQLPAPLWVPKVGEAQRAATKFKVWGDMVPGVDQGDAAAKWLQSFLGKEGLRLVLVAESAHRTTDPEFGVGETAFADGFPILLTSQASVDEVNRRVKGGTTVTLNNFRPNVHVTGCDAFEEDEMPAITFECQRGPSQSTARMALVKPCSRCTVPGVNPRTGMREASGEPVKVLRVFRHTRQLQKSNKLHKAFFRRPDMKDQVFFGQNVHATFSPGAVLSIGDMGEVAW